MELFLKHNAFETLLLSRSPAVLARKEWEQLYFTLFTLLAILGCSMFDFIHVYLTLITTRLVWNLTKI